MHRPPHVVMRDDMPAGLDYIAGRLDDGMTFLVLRSGADALMIARGWAALRAVRRQLAA